ncbi:MAG: hypothetical protein MZW92_23570 [Comamonadaceae bacterium]|nr:hypothetical protein [Comamonadaceae bacterium]
MHEHANAHDAAGGCRAAARAGPRAALARWRRCARERRGSVGGLAR